MEKERPSVFRMMQRGGHVVINLPADVQQKTIESLIKATIVAGILVYTDEYSIDTRLQSWGYNHKSVNHGRDEFARDEEVTAFVQSMCIRWKGAGRSGAAGFGRIGAFPQRNSRFIWGSSSVCTTSASEVKRCFLRSWSYWSRKTLESNMSARRIKRS